MLPLGFENLKGKFSTDICAIRYLQKTCKLTVEISLFPNSRQIGDQNFTVIRVFWNKKRVICFPTFFYVFQTSNFKEKQLNIALH